MEIKYSVDGGQTWHDAPEGVRVSVEGVMVPGLDQPGQLDCNFTHEGIIDDVWVDADGVRDHNWATQSITYNEILELMAELQEVPS